MDLRPGELALLVPLVGVLLALSVWPAGISSHSFAGDSPTTGSQGAVQVIATPHIDWFAISTILVLLGASFIALLCAVLVPRRIRRVTAASVAALGFVGGLVTSIWLYVDSADRRAA